MVLKSIINLDFVKLETLLSLPYFFFIFEIFETSILN